MMTRVRRDYLRVALAFCGVDDADVIGVVSFTEAGVLFEQRVVEEVGDQLYNLVDGEKLARLLLNLKGVEYLSSSMLAKLVGLRKRVEQADGQLKLCGLSPVVSDTFKAARLNNLFEIHPDELSALDQF